MFLFGKMRATRGVGDAQSNWLAAGPLFGLSACCGPPIEAYPLKRRKAPIGRSSCISLQGRPSSFPWSHCVAGARLLGSLCARPHRWPQLGPRAGDDSVIAARSARRRLWQKRHDSLRDTEPSPARDCAVAELHRRLCHPRMKSAAARPVASASPLGRASSLMRLVQLSAGV